MAVYKRGKIWWVKFQAGGEEYRRSSGTAKKREAQAFERKLREEVAKQLHYQRTGTKTLRTWSDAVIKWVESGAPKSMYSHARNTRPYLDKVPLHLVPVATNEMKSDMLKKGLKPTTINRRIAVVQRVLNLAYDEWHWIDEPLARKVKKLSEKSLEREFYLSHEEVEQLANAISDPVAKAVVMVAAYSGMRKGEILSLSGSNWKAPYVILSSKTKSGKPRAIPVIDKIAPLMDLLPFDITEHRLRREFELARVAIERPEIRFHDLRHTYASWLASNPDVPLSVIRDVLGHSNLSVTSKYTHLRGQHIDLINVVLGG